MRGLSLYWFVVFALVASLAISGQDDEEPTIEDELPEHIRPNKALPKIEVEDHCPAEYRHRMQEFAQAVQAGDATTVGAFLEANRGQELLARHLLGQSYYYVIPEATLRDPRAPSMRRLTALQIGAAFGRVDVILVLLDFALQNEDLEGCVLADCEIGWTAVHFAAAHGFVNVLRALLEFAETSPFRMSLLFRKGLAFTPLINAATFGRAQGTQMLLDFVARHPDVAEALLADDSGFSALGSAISLERRAVVRILLNFATAHPRFAPLILARTRYHDPWALARTYRNEEAVALLERLEEFHPRAPDEVNVTEWVTDSEDELLNPAIRAALTYSSTPL